jgi:hypothetical protein
MDASNCQHDQHTCVQHAEGQLDLETDPVMVVCRRHGVGGYISRETPLVMHTVQGTVAPILISGEKKCKVQTSHQARKRAQKDTSDM